MPRRKYNTDEERREARNRAAREWYHRNRDATRVKSKEYRGQPDVKERIRLQKKHPVVLAQNRARHAARYVENKRVVWQLKADHGCKYCGINDPICLEFHHRDPEAKRCNVGELMGNLLALLKEAEKCDVVCANCHCYLTGCDLDGRLCVPPYLRTD